MNPDLLKDTGLSNAAKQSPRPALRHLEATARVLALRLAITLLQTKDEGEREIYMEDLRAAAPYAARLVEDELSAATKQRLRWSANAHALIALSRAFENAEVSRA